MTSREQLIAYLATIGALVLIILGAMGIAAASADVIGKMEAFGIGTVTGGLIGVLKIPAARNPVASTDSGDVNVSGGKP